jgi:hypothetical protein
VRLAVERNVDKETRGRGMLWSACTRLWEETLKL